jgi:cytochrome c oxidase cbb3-type subunit 2
MQNGAKLYDLEDHLAALKTIGDPYTDEMVKVAEKDASVQALGEARADISGLQTRYGEKVNARDFDGQPNFISEMDALVAYLQVLGTMVDFNNTEAMENKE